MPCRPSYTPTGRASKRSTTSSGRPLLGADTEIPLSPSQLVSLDQTSIVLDDPPGTGIAGVVSRPAAYPSNTERISTAIYRYAQARAAHELPEHATRLHTAARARDRSDAAGHAYYTARAEVQRDADSHGVTYHGYDTGAADQLPALTEQVRAARARVTAADDRVDRLASHPLSTGQPDPAAVLDAARAQWSDQREQARLAAHNAARREFAHASLALPSHHEPWASPDTARSGPGISR